MTVLSETVQIPIIPITIKRGALGTIRIGPTEIEIPAEDVTITTASISVNFLDEMRAIVTAEFAKLKQSILVATKLSEAVPSTVVKWPEGRKKGESPKET